jgi:hypothetical protein
MYVSIFPPGAANNWWITARSPFAGMRAVLSEPTPRVEQNSALLHYAVTLRQIAQVSSVIQNICFPIKRNNPSFAGV